MKTGDVQAEVREALEGRAAFYDMLASFYFKPLTEEQIENIATTDFSAYADVNERFAEGFHDMSRYLAKRNSGTRQELAVDFTAAFAGTSSWKGKYAVPYESVFTSDEGLLFQGAYHEVHRVFKEQHVELAQGYDYPDDHLSFMCEFMGILSRRTIEALEQGDMTEARAHIELSRTFLAQHIRSWFDRLVERANLLLQTRFYRGVLKMSGAFFQFDAEVLDDVTEILQAA